MEDLSGLPAVGSLGNLNVAFASTGYGPLFAPAVSSWLRVVAYTSRYFTVHHIGKIGGMGITDRQYTHSAECQLVRDMFEIENETGDRFTHLFMTESDMVLPKDAIVTLAAMDKDIASGIYFLRNGNGQPCIYRKVLTLGGNPYGHSPVSTFPLEEPFRAEAFGLGCVLIKRNVFGRVAEPWFDLAEGKYGSDMYFYTKAREAGIEAWGNPAVMCGQMDYSMVTIKEHLDRIKNDPAYVGSGYMIGPNKWGATPNG